VNIPEEIQKHKDKIAELLGQVRRAACCGTCKFFEEEAYEVFGKCELRTTTVGMCNVCGAFNETKQ
jgi:hypothetical protein